MNEKKKKQEKKKNVIIRILIKIYRFFIPKNFKEEMLKGRIIGEQIKQGAMSPKIIPTWYIGKGLRKLIDPKHKMKVGKDKTNGQEK